jgi:hypothetical protein
LEPNTKRAAGIQRDRRKISSFREPSARINRDASNNQAAPRCAVLRKATGSAAPGTIALCVLMLIAGNMRAVNAEQWHWTFESASSEALGVDVALQTTQGISGQCVLVDGRVVLKPDLGPTANAFSREFTLTAWVNPYRVGEVQQMIVGKNQYALDHREWSVMIDRDGRFRLYVWQDKWRTIDGPRAERGRWYRVSIRKNADRMELFVNGKPQGAVDLRRPLSSTPAPLTFAGIDDGGRRRQMLHGALDEVRLVSKALSNRAIVSSYQPVRFRHTVPEPSPRIELWDADKSLPRASNIETLDHVQFHVIKKWDQDDDGYVFLHGVGLGWHRDQLFASFAHNQGAENTVTEEAHYRVSNDGGRTWGPLEIIDQGREQNLAVSHGVFLSHNGALWAFHGAYHGKMRNIHTRAYRFDDRKHAWEPLGVVVENGFWPMNSPVKMDDGNWIMPGFSAGPYSHGVFPAAVAISRGDDLTHWDHVEIPVGKEIHQMWGESALIVDGRHVINIARHGGSADALIAESDDFGRTWTESRRSNLPMATSKPTAGVLSTGQRYLVCTTAKDNGGKRSPLTIAVSRPGENRFSKVFVVRRSEHLNQPGESAERLSLSYPYAVEHEGKLYVGYSNNGGRKGNLNSAELAIIPIDQLAVPR